MLTNQKVNARNSVDGKKLHNFLEERKFSDSRRGNESTRDRTVIPRFLKIDYIFPEKEALKNTEDDFDEVAESSDFDESPSNSASGLKKVFLSENLEELSDRLCLIIQEKQGRNDSKFFNNGNLAIVDKLLE